MAERLLQPHDDLSFLRGDAPELDRKLREGDGVGWAGDPDLYLAQGIVEEQRSGRLTGKILARRWEVWRYCDDGVERLLAHWRMEEFDRILFDLARMRAESPSHVDVADALDLSDAARQKHLSGQFRDAYGEMLSHMASLYVDRVAGKNTFRGIPGLNPEKQL